MMRARLALLAVLVLLLCGCQDPYQGNDPLGSTVTTPAAGDTPAAETPRPQPSMAMGEQSPHSPRSAVEAFCLQWANWNWRTLQRQQRRLAAMAVGEFARQLTDEAALRADDRSLRRDRIGSEGTVVAVDVKAGTRERRAVCVARETPMSGARADTLNTRHRVYLATVARTARGWGIRAWQPQP